MSNFIKVTIASRPQNVVYLNFNLISCMIKCTDGESTHLWLDHDDEYSVVETPEEILQLISNEESRVRIVA